MKPFSIFLSYWDLRIFVAFSKMKKRRWKASGKLSDGEKPIREKRGNPAAKPYALFAWDVSADAHASPIGRSRSTGVGSSSSCGGRSFDECDRTCLSWRTKPEDARHF